MAKTCPYCRETGSGADLAECPACGTPHHHDCWVENGGCTVFGCEHAPADDPKISLTSDELSPLNSPIARPNPGNNASYFIARDGQQFGPYVVQELQRYLAEGRIFQSDLAWTQGMQSWSPVSQVLGNASSSVALPRPAPPARTQYQTLRDYPHSNPSHPQRSHTVIVKPQNFMTSAILATLFCCIPFGIVSIVYASQVDSKFSAGDYDGAQEASSKAKNWYHAALISGILIGVIVFIANLN